MPFPHKLFGKVQKAHAKNILLLGNYNDEQCEKFLGNMKQAIERNFKYTVTTVKEMQEKSKILSNKTPRQVLHQHLSNVVFVIADDTVPSGVIVELEHCLHCGSVVAIISRECEKGMGCRRSTWMTIDYHIHSPNFRVFEYVGKIDAEGKINKLLDKIVRFGESRRKKILEDFKEADRAYKSKKKKHFKQVKSKAVSISNHTKVSLSTKAERA